jgi:hypothetical protein
MFAAIKAQQGRADWRQVTVASIMRSIITRQEPRARRNDACRVNRSSQPALEGCDVIC